MRLLRYAVLTVKGQNMSECKRKTLSVILLLIVVPTVIVGGSLLFRDRLYSWISVAVAILSCLPFFIAFENKKTAAKELAVLSVMVALSVIGRFIFAWCPGFKPVTAITVTAALWLGADSGFLIGSLSAAVSGFYFGQGPWTPFQMFAWGTVGFIAGLLSKQLKKSMAALCIYGAFAGVLFSMIMDIWTVLWMDKTFILSRYLAAIVSAFPVTAEYALSNVIFLIVLAKPIGEKLNRIKKKYGLFLTVDD